MGIQATNRNSIEYHQSRVHRSLSQAMRDLLPMQTLMKEIADMTRMRVDNTIAHCKSFEDREGIVKPHSTVYEDNKGCVELTKSLKTSPHTRHIAIKYHYFREHAWKGHLTIKWIGTSEQLAYIFTKPLLLKAFTYLREKLLGW
jgi:hypothetical protein